MNRNDFRYFLREGVKSLFSHGVMSIASVGITTACLLIMGNFSLIAYNVNLNVDKLLDENVVVAFVDENLDLISSQNIQADIEALDNIKDVSFVTKESARNTYVEQYDTDNLYTDLDADVFRHRYVIHLKNMDLIERTAEELSHIDGIEKVRADAEISEGFSAVKDIALTVSISMIGTLLVVSLFIISNTIKMTFFDRKEEIAIMRIVGATKSFVRWPFVFEGFMMGTSSALIGFFIQTLIYNSVSTSIRTSDTLEMFSIAGYENIWYIVFLAFVVAGILIGTIGSLVAVRRYVKV